jgi:hypothetical protein
MQWRCGGVSDSLADGIKTALRRLVFEAYQTGECCGALNRET